MKNFKKYTRGYFMPPTQCLEWTKKEYLNKPPSWCSVDLRDGNQALITPMSLDEKILFFNALVKVGFKEIEIGFPAASETEYEFCRYLIDNKLIPSDVTIQVLTQAREHIIEKTFKALEGINKAVVHVYNSTSYAQREQVFKKSKDEIKQIAINGARLLNETAKKTKGNFTFEYSPESFTGTEPEFALDVINAVLDEWKPTAKNKCIINLPDTVQMSMPHVFASQVEYISTNMKYRENVILSLHPHNDRGTAISASELGLLAGGDRIEGTLFGNGERTGNVDIITLAMNMFTHGVDPLLDFSDINNLVEVYEKVTQLQVNPRQPYAGSLVFTAFSGSHQDAIAKGLAFRDDTKPKHWTIPYLPLDPSDVGRSYDKDVIRINSQSGKGGIGYLMEQTYGYKLPAEMKENFGYRVKDVSDKAHKELKNEEVLQVFNTEYVNIDSPIAFVDYNLKKAGEQTTVTINYANNGKTVTASGTGNGSLDAISSTLKAELLLDYNSFAYSEHALGKGSTAKAVAYVGIKCDKTSFVWAVGIDNDIITASAKALVGAINKGLKK